MRRRFLIAIWLCFLCRGSFYAVAFPLWEGYDEWAHFGVIERIAFRGELLVSRDSPVSRAIETSLELVPIPWDLRRQPPPLATHDRYWRFPAEERARREAAFRLTPPALSHEDGSRFPAYEALQPPLYYWICAPILFALRNHSLATQIVVLRLFSALIASPVIPLTFRIAQSIFRAGFLALGCAAIIAAMPGFAIDTARVANDSLAIVLFTLLISLMLNLWRQIESAEKVGIGRVFQQDSALGIIFGLGLLTKAYFLTAIPPLALLYLRGFLANPKSRSRAAAQAALAAASAALIAGWWYIRNFLQTGTFSGLDEAVKFRPPASLLARVAEIHWLKAADAILFSHLWFGGWSALTLRSPFYHFFYVLITLAAIGLLRLRRDPNLLLVTAIYASFWLGQFYFVWLLYAKSGMSTSMGWYMYAVVAAEVILCVAGLRAIATPILKRSVIPIGVCAFAVLDLVAMHAVALPYYSGLISHRSDGRLETFHPSAVDLSGIFARLTGFKPISESALAALWCVYVLATLALIAVTIIASSTDEPRSKTGSVPVHSERQ